MSAEQIVDDRSRQYATFMVGDLYFGIDVLEVQEVLRNQQMTPAPRADRVIEGLINLRGQIVTAFDVRRRLGLPPRPAEDEPMNVVIRSDDGAVSLLVDEIGDVIEVDPETFEGPAPDNRSRRARSARRRLQTRGAAAAGARRSKDAQGPVAQPFSRRYQIRHGPTFARKSQKHRSQPEPAGRQSRRGEA